MRILLYLAFLSILISCKDKPPAKPAKKQNTIHATGLELTKPTQRFFYAWTNIYTFKSKILNRSFRLTVVIPPSYFKSKEKSNKNTDSPDQHYPAYYVLDANWHLTLLDSVYKNLVHDEIVDKAIVVGVSWGDSPGGLAQPRMQQQRLIDLTPPQFYDENSPTGSMLFQEVLEKEVFPFIEHEYRTTQNKTLVGSSAAALFATYTYATRPELFDNFVAISPKPYPKKDLFEFYKSLNEADYSGEPKNLYIAKGGYEITPELDDFMTFVKTVNLPNTNLKTEVIARTGHGTVNNIGYVRALQFVAGKIKE